MVKHPTNWLSPGTLEEVKTPALIFDQSRLEDLLSCALAARRKAGVNLLFAVKALALPHVLEYLATSLDGFAVSSLFEARFIRAQFPGKGIHFTSPGLRYDDILALVTLLDFVSFNSRTQFCRYGDAFRKRSSLGIRVNTGISNVADHRYDPCRPGSKLGIPIEEVSEILCSATVSVHGLHIHTNSDSTNFGELLDNVRLLVEAIPKEHSLKWVNLGGGYLFEDVSLEPLAEAVDLLKGRFGAEVFVEPGSGLVRSAGFLVSSVLDVFDVDGRQIAVLDTTVNHMPEVLEFDYQPGVVGQCEDGPFEYVLAGATCLAGDIFGAYKFSAPLEVGSKVVLEEAGAYTLAKAHRFNGVNLPDVGMSTNSGRYKVVKAFTYDDFESYWKTNA